MLWGVYRTKKLQHQPYVLEICWYEIHFFIFFPLIIHLSGYDLVGESLYSGWVILFGEL